MTRGLILLLSSLMLSCASFSYSSAAHQLASLFQSSHSQGTQSVVSLLELVYSSGWSHLLPQTQRPHSALPFYTDVMGLPLDVLALLGVIIAIAVYACTYAWRLVVGGSSALWTGAAKWQ